MNNIKIKLGRKIKYYREANNLTQEQLAEKISLNFRSLSLIERGVNFVTADTLEAICVALNVTPKQLFDFSVCEENPTDKKEAIIEILNNNHDIIDVLYKIIKTFVSIEK